MNEEEILYNKIYERTKEFGRTHFIKEIMRLQRENENLKEKIKALTSKNAGKKIFGEYKNVRLTQKEFKMLIECYGEELTKQLIMYLDEYIEMKGYKAKSHYLCIKKWVVDAVKEKKYKYKKQPIREEKVPEWLDKKIEPTLPTEEELKEMQELLKIYK